MPRELSVRTVQTEVDQPPERPPLPNPRPLDLSPVDWSVVTPDTIPEGDSWSLFGLTPEQYEALSYNMAELLRWITEAEYRLRYYRGEITADEIPEGESQ